jgi:GT2 family glycosyltransferase
MSRFAVVICAHDSGRWRHLQAAVLSVQRQALPADELILVVDRNADLLRRATELEGVRVVENTDHPGLGGARNSGIAASRAPLVAFLDDDAVASERWLEHLATPYADPDVAGVGGAIEPAWETGRPRWFPEEFDWVVGCTFRGMPENGREVRNLLGCNMSYRREALEALGRFRLGYGCDETELCIRLRQRWPEKKLVYVPEAAVSHFVPASRSTFPRFLSRCYFEGGSKAVVAHLVGRNQGLASERAYTFRTLPRAVSVGIAALIRDGDVSGIGRSAAVVLGFLSTAAGYVSGSLSLTESARRRGWAGDVRTELRAHV